MTFAHGSHRAARGRTARHRPAGSAPVRRLLPRVLVITALVGGVTGYVQHDKEVHLEVDGTRRTVHTFAGDVGELLERRRVRVTGRDAVTPAPGTPLADGDTVTVAPARQLTVTVDGRRHRVRTTALTVEDALAGAGIALRERDATSVPRLSFPRDGLAVEVTRIRGAALTRDEPVPFPVVRRRDPGLFRGAETVVVRGEEGLRRVTYASRTPGGRPVRVAEQVLRAPVTQVVAVGTRPLPASVADTAGLNWSALAACETGGRADLVDPSGTYGGLYQLTARTWRELGGTGRPERASRGEQTWRARHLYVRQGASPWPVCGRRLFT
ncbi:hypothetical protein GCM10027168_34250 [Streptomyces capparidis]